MENEELLMHVMTKTTGLSESELREKLYDGDVIKADASEILINLDADRVSKIKNSVDKTEVFNEAYKKATKDEREKIEKKFKAEFGIESELQGIDLFKEYVESVKVKPTLTEDEIKIHPKYVGLEKEIAERYSKSYDDLKVDFEAYKSGVEQNITMSAVLRDAESFFVALNPVLSENQVIAKNQKETFLDKFKNYEYELVDGKHLVKENGKRIEDKHGNPVYLDTFVSSLTSQNFDTKVQDSRESAGNRQRSSASSNAPKTREEYNKAIMEAQGDDAKIAEIAAAWRAVNG